MRIHTELFTLGLLENRNYRHDDKPLASIAMSLKRIADAMEQPIVESSETTARDPAPRIPF